MDTYTLPRQPSTPTVATPQNPLGYNTLKTPLSPDFNDNTGVGTPGSSSSFFKNKLNFNTLGRRKKRQTEANEAKDLTMEGNAAILAPQQMTLRPLPTYVMEEGDTQTHVPQDSLEGEKFKELVHCVLTWINSTLCDQRIVVKSISSDFFDGQILQKLLELFDVKVNYPEVIQAESVQRERLGRVLAEFNSVLRITPSYANKHWPLEKIFNCDLVCTCNLLISIARSRNVRLPPDVCIKQVTVKMINGVLKSDTVDINLTKSLAESSHLRHRASQQINNGANIIDGFDALMKTQQAKLELAGTLLNFVNENMRPLMIEVKDLDESFKDGIILIQLLNFLGGYFTPLCYYCPITKSNQDKLKNCRLAFQLMEETGILPLWGDDEEQQHHRDDFEPEDVVVGDEKVVMKVLYRIYTFYSSSSASASHHR